MSNQLRRSQSHGWLGNAPLSFPLDFLELHHPQITSLQVFSQVLFSLIIVVPVPGLVPKSGVAGLSHWAFATLQRACKWAWEDPGTGEHAWEVEKLWRWERVHTGLSSGDKDQRVWKGLRISCGAALHVTSQPEPGSQDRGASSQMRADSVFS